MANARLGAPPLPDKTISAIQRMYRAGHKHKDIMDKLGVSQASVAKYTRGLSKRAPSPPTSAKDEIWKLIPGFGGRYYVSNQGRVFSNGINGGRPGIMKPANNGKGYLMVILCWGGVKEARSVHRLVAEAFVPGKTEERCCVNHKDGNGINDVAENLEWVTYSENMVHSFEVLGHRTPKGIPSKSRKLTASQVRAIRADRRPAEQVAKDYGIGHSTVSNVRRRAYYREVA